MKRALAGVAAVALCACEPWSQLDQRAQRCQQEGQCGDAGDAGDAGEAGDAGATGVCSLVPRVDAGACWLAGDGGWGLERVFGERGGPGSADGTGQEARLRQGSRFLSAAGRLFGRDSFGRVFEVLSPDAPAGGTVVTLGWLGEPVPLGGGLAFDAARERLYAATRTRIHSFSTVSCDERPLAGAREAGTLDVTEPPATAARFSTILALALDGDRLLVSEGAVLREVDLLRETVRTRAGALGSSALVDGEGLSARFLVLRQLVAVPDGGLFGLDSSVLRRIEPTSFRVTTLDAGPFAEGLLTAQDNEVLLLDAQGESLVRYDAFTGQSRLQPLDAGASREWTFQAQALGGALYGISGGVLQRRPLSGLSQAFNVAGLQGPDGAQPADQRLYLPSQLAGSDLRTRFAVDAFGLRRVDIRTAPTPGQLLFHDGGSSLLPDEVSRLLWLDGGYGREQFLAVAGGLRLLDVGSGGQSLVYPSPTLNDAVFEGADSLVLLESGTTLRRWRFDGGTEQLLGPGDGGLMGAYALARAPGAAALYVLDAVGLRRFSPQALTLETLLPRARQALDGPASCAALGSMGTLAASDERIYLTDRSHLVRAYELATGTVSTLVGSPDQAIVRWARPKGLVNEPVSLFVSGDGRIEVLDSAEGTISRLVPP